MLDRKRKTLVLEIERIQLIRRKCQAHLRYCGRCRSTADFISLAAAAALFDVDPVNLLGCIRANACHFINDPEGVFLCVNSFLNCLNANTNGSKIKMICGNKQK